MNEILFVFTFPVCMKFNVSYAFPLQDRSGFHHCRLLSEIQIFSAAQILKKIYPFPTNFLCIVNVAGF